MSWREKALAILSATESVAASEGVTELPELTKPPVEPGFVNSVPIVTAPDIERAAIIEEGARVPREWADAFADLQGRPPPAGYGPSEWLSILSGAGRFLDQWGGKAAALGWSADELFGLGIGRRQDNKGAAFLLREHEVIAITGDEITVRAGRSVSCIRRAWRSNAGPAWGKQ